MTKIKKVIFVLLSFLPIHAIALAVEYNANVAFPAIDQKALREEFLKKLDSEQLPEKYYNFLEKNGIFSSDDLIKRESSSILRRVLKKYCEERIDEKVMASIASSILPD